MGTDTINQAVDGTVIPADNHNSIRGALSQDFYPRNSSGVVADEAGDLGSATYEWKKIYVKDMEISGSIVQLTGFDVLPSGIVVPYSGSTAPTGWLLCKGETIGNTGSGATHTGSEYETLFDLIKTAYGNAGTESFSGGDTVLLPDPRGRFVRCLDQGKGIDSGRGIGTTQADATGDHTHQWFNYVGSGSTGSEITTDVNGGNTNQSYNSSGSLSAITNNSNIVQSYYTAVNGSILANETRPDNFAFPYIIKI